jgi:hypothetical protein
MQKPDWKVAVIGGSIAALGLGGFAAAQQGGSTGDSVPEGIRLQRDASVSLHSLSSVVTATVRADDSTSVASLNSLNSVSAQSIDSVPSVAPAPQPAPSGSWDSDSVSVASVDSVSFASVASLASVDSIDSSD